MDQRTFEAFVRRASDLLDRRSLMGGLSAALLAPGLAPLDAEGKKGKGKGKDKACKRRVKDCRKEEDDICEGNEECKNALKKCTKKCCQSIKKANGCCANAGFCESGATASALYG